jgi:hypothetical protein
MNELSYSFTPSYAFTACNFTFAIREEKVRIYSMWGKMNMISKRERLWQEKRRKLFAAWAI